MRTAIGAALPGAVALLVLSFTVVLVVLVLVSTRPPAVAAAFVAGWMVGLGCLATITLAAEDLVLGLLDSGGDNTFTGWIRIGLALVLVILAARQWRSRLKAGDVAEQPAWITRMATVTTARGFGVGILLGAANPKNAVLVVSGLTSVVAVTSVVGEQVVAAVVFVVVASLGIGLPVVLRLALGDRATKPLQTAIDALARHNATIMTGVFAVLAVVLLVNGIHGLR